MARRRGLVQLVADAMLQQGDVGEGVVLGDADALAEFADGGGGHAAAAQAAERGQARVVPALDELELDQFEQLALAHDGIGQRQARELHLLGGEAGGSSG